MNKVKATQIIQDLHYVARVMKKYDAKHKFYNLHQKAQGRYNINYYNDLSREGYDE